MNYRVPRIGLDTGDFGEKADLGPALTLLILAPGRQLQTVKCRCWETSVGSGREEVCSPCPSAGARLLFSVWGPGMDHVRRSQQAVEKLFLFIPLGSVQMLQTGVVDRKDVPGTVTAALPTSVGIFPLPRASSTDSQP